MYCFTDNNLKRLGLPSCGSATPARGVEMAFVDQTETFREDAPLDGSVIVSSLGERQA